MWDYSYMTPSSMDDYLMIDFEAGFDFGYETTYAAGLTDSSGTDLNTGDSTSAWRYESYGFEVYADFTVDLAFTIFDVYEWAIEIELVILDLTPYTQQISWTRPNDWMNGDFDIRISAWYDVALFALEVTYVEDAKTTEVSLMDYIDDSSMYTWYPDSSNFDFYSEQDWDDYLLSIDVIEEYILPAIDSSTLDEFYGMHEWYGCWLFMTVGGCDETYY